MAIYDVLKSEIDASTNFVSEHPVQGLIEARFVQRTEDYVIVYLSSQSNCALSCRFCHLTASGQNKPENITPAEFIDQASVVLDHYDQSGIEAPLVHFNFMARGEALDNPYMLSNSNVILQPLADMAGERGLAYKFLVSTIMPTSLGDRKLTEIFKTPDLYPEIYYSIYSMNPKFRKRWLPRSMEPQKALALLADWQSVTGKTPKIHHAFIKGENDSEQDVREVCEAINAIGLKVNFNIVRYNPYSSKYGEESDEATIERNVAIMNELLKPEKSRVVPKVGFDVKASCGMFVEGLKQ